MSGCPLNNKLGFKEMEGNWCRGSFTSAHTVYVHFTMYIIYSMYHTVYVNFTMFIIYSMYHIVYVHFTMYITFSRYHTVYVQFIMYKIYSTYHTVYVHFTMYIIYSMYRTVYVHFTMYIKYSMYHTGSRSTFEFPIRVNLSGPSLYCTARTLGLKRRQSTGLGGATRLTWADFMLHIQGVPRNMTVDK